jgi:hypothetical protein
MCKPFGTCESRVVALWKDSKAGPFEIELPYDAQGVVISLKAEFVEQWTADDRSDETAAASWILRAIFLSEEDAKLIGIIADNPSEHADLVDLLQGEAREIGDAIVKSQNGGNLESEAAQEARGWANQTKVRANR